MSQIVEKYPVSQC